MKYTYNHNPEKDIEVVIPNLSIVLTDVNETLTIKDTGQTITDNGIEETSEIYGIARDNFAVVKAQDAILEKVNNRRNSSKNQGEPQWGNNA